MAEDIRLQLITGQPIHIDSTCSVYPLTIGEISLIGEMEYNKYLSILTCGLDQMRESLMQNHDLPNDITIFDILVENCKEDKELLEASSKALSIFTKQEAIFVEEYSVFVLGEDEDGGIITRENFGNISEALKLQNNISTEVKVVKKLSDREKRLLEKRERGRKMLAESKGQDNITLSDIVSVMGVFISDIDRISDYTIYQLYNQYERFMSRVNYESNFSMMIAGADSKNLELDKHWTGNANSNKNKKVEKE